VAVVRSGGEKKPVLEPRREVPDGPRDVGVDGVLLAACGRGVVRLVPDEECAAAEIAEPVAERAGVCLID
jgi:hypothetical protein